MRRSFLGILALAFGGLMSFASAQDPPGGAPPQQPAAGQRPTRPPAANTKPANNAPEGEEELDLKPRLVTLQASDGMAIRCAYYPSDKGKQAVPVIIVHGWEDQAQPHANLAALLQQRGFAVMLPDLRGHGGSVNARDAAGRIIQLEPKRMSRVDLRMIMSGDLEAVKAFLREENNASRCNLNALAVIGIQEGCIFAANWAVTDWEWPSLPGEKQGQDVKALVMVSPARSLKGFNADLPFKHVAVSRLPTQFIAGASSAEAKEVDRIAKVLDRVRASDPTAGRLDVQLPNTSLSGERLVNQFNGTMEVIAQFLETELQQRIELFPWVQRD